MTQGDKATCATCKQPIDYIGGGWRHTGGQQVGHVALPAKNDELRPADVIRMGLGEFAWRFGFRPADRLEKKWYAQTRARITARERAATADDDLGDLDGVNMEE